MTQCYQCGKKINWWNKTWLTDLDSKYTYNQRLVHESCLNDYINDELGVKDIKIKELEKSNRVLKLQLEDHLHNNQQQDSRNTLTQR